MVKSIKNLKSLYYEVAKLRATDKIWFLRKLKLNTEVREKMWLREFFFLELMNLVSVCRFLSIVGILVGIFSILALFSVALAVFLKKGRRHHQHFFQAKPNNCDSPTPNPDIIPNFNFPGKFVGII